MSKTYDINIRQAVHNNNFWWNLKQLPRVLKSNYSKRFPKNRPWQSSYSNVLIKKASNKIDFENGYSVKYQSCISNSAKHLWWRGFFRKKFKFIIEIWQSPNYTGFFLKYFGLFDWQRFNCWLLFLRRYSLKFSKYPLSKPEQQAVTSL